MTYSLDLFFLPGKGEEYPVPPIAQIFIKTHTSGNYEGKAANLKFVTPQCVSLVEIEYEIKRLHEELDTILKRARRRFAKEYPHAS